MSFLNPSTQYQDAKKEIHEKGICWDEKQQGWRSVHIRICFLRRSLKGTETWLKIANCCKEAATQRAAIHSKDVALVYLFMTCIQSVCFVLQTSTEINVERRCFLQKCNIKVSFLILRPSTVDFRADDNVRLFLKAVSDVKDKNRVGRKVIRLMNAPYLCFQAPLELFTSLAEPVFFSKINSLANSL